MSSTQQEENKSTLIPWVIFLVSLVITLWLLFTKPEWFWVPLPFVLTYFVVATNKI